MEKTYINTIISEKNRDLYVKSMETPDSRCSARTQPFGLSELTFEEVEDIDGNKELVHRSDVSILIYEKSLESASDEAIKQFLANATSNRHEKLPFNDEQLFSIIKSRYIQSHQDIATYLKSLESEYDSIVREASEYINNLQDDFVKKNESVDNPNS